MKRLLLLPLLLGFTSAVNAETYWLVLKVGVSRGALEKIEMKSMEQCKEEGVNLKVETQNTIATLA